MSFLQPMLLAALPLVALPIIIHLINQRRYQTIRWAAMMFLLAANRMSRGYARLRQWLIMAFRMAVIAALIFAVSRPLAGGWLGLAGGNRADTTIIVLDRSPSMQQTSAGGGGSKLETGRRQLVKLLETLGSSHWVVIESSTNLPRELESLDALSVSPSAGPTSASSDLPAMLLAARDYIRANKSGRTEIWICSDLRENDWNAESGRWQSLRDGFLEFAQGVRFHLLAYPRTAPENLAVRVTGVRRQPTTAGAELLVSLSLTRKGPVERRASVPVHFEIEGARSELTVEIAGPKYELKDHRIPLERSHVRGWGKVSIPADANLADNDDWFVFDEPAPRHAVVVADDPQAARPLQLAAGIAPDPLVKCSTEVVGAGKLGTVEWEKVALLLWQAPLPDVDAAKLVQALVDRGGRVIFFPPKNPGPGEFRGIRWTTWVDRSSEVAVETWRGDQDLLAQTQSGGPLPVGQLQVRKYCGLSGDLLTLAALRGGAPLLARLTTNSGGVYFCSTTPAVGDSSLATGGVVLYIMVQRALADGAKLLGTTRELTAGEPAGEDPTRWKRLAAAEEAMSTDYPQHRGIYQSDDRLLAVTRGAAEDLAPVLADDRLAGLFRGLDFARVDDQAGNISALIQEVWRLFLTAMMVAMVVEAGLCMPRPRPAGGTST
jgi:Aerotolerance regulator N-terminal